MPSANPVHTAVFDLVTVIIPNPGAGNEIDYSVPANARIQVIYLGFIFSTNATVADRYIQILGTTPTLNQVMACTSVPQTASNIWGQAFVAGLPEAVDLSANNQLITPLSPNLILEPGDALETLAVNGTAGDTYQSIICRFKQWVIA